MYAYHYQDANHRLIFHYDNVAHRPALSSPVHKHTESDVEGTSVPTLSEISITSSGRRTHELYIRSSRSNYSRGSEG